MGCLDNNHCTADVAAAICDEESFSCRGCIANSECTSRVCGEGICADEADIVYVDKVTGADSASCGTVLDPCATIGAGIGQSSGTRNTVLIAEGTYLERITILNKDVRLRGEGRVVVQANLADSEHVLSVSGVSDVDIQDMEFGMLAAPATADAVLCTTSTTSLILRNVTVNEASDTGVVGDNCTLSLVGSTIIASGGIGVEMTGGTLNMHASFVLLNANGGIDIDDANYSLVNNIVNNNGGPGSVIGGVRIERTSARNEEFLFNTVAQNSRASGATTGSALRCELSNVVASSNIFMLEDTSSAALVTGCSTQYSLFDTADTMPVGTGNISAEAVFINPAARDFHLDPSSPGNDSAEPGTGVATDIDGNERPLQDAPDMGADQTP